MKGQTLALVKNKVDENTEVKPTLSTSVCPLKWQKQVRPKAQHISTVSRMLGNNYSFVFWLAQRY